MNSASGFTSIPGRSGRVTLPGFCLDLAPNVQLLGQQFVPKRVVRRFEFQHRLARIEPAVHRGHGSKRLHVDRHHLKSVLGMVAQVVQNAVLAGSTRRREHHVADAQGLSQFCHELAAEAQVDGFDGTAAVVEFRNVPHFHVALVVHPNCRGKPSKARLLYVKAVVKNGC